MCAFKNPHIIAIAETWFTKTSIVNLEGFTLYSRNREDGRKGGGVALYIDSKLISYEVNEGVLTNNKVEQIWVTLVNKNCKYLIGCVYRPNEQTDMIEMSQIFTVANNLIGNNHYSDLLILGDFNFPNIKWSNGYVHDIISGEESIENQFSDIINDCFLYQHVCMPTFQQSQQILNNTLDLILTKNTERVYELESNPVLGNITHGHLVLTFKFSLDDVVSEEISKYKFDYTRGDFYQISQYLDVTDWNELFEDLPVQDMYDLFIIKISQACNKFVPIIDVNSNKKSKKHQWYTDEVSRLVRTKQDLRYQNLASNWKNTVKVKEYKQICKLVTKEAIRARVNFEQNLVKKSKLNPKLLYKYVNSQKKVKYSIKALRCPNSCVTNDQNEIVEILNQQFQDVFTIEDSGIPLPEMDMTENNDICLPIIEYIDVARRLKIIDTNKTCGVDSIHPLIMKNCADSIALPLTLIYKESLEKSELPIQWRSANITPLFKKGDKLEAANYRPVSLTSIPCKIMEGIIRDCFQTHLNKYSLISNEQHGFVKGKSCTTNLLETLDFISYNLSMGIPIDEALLDFVKAFDSVAHKRLILKLKFYGIRGLALKWVEAFLTDRIQRVIQGNAVSSWKDIFSGVPQGSVIGPLLFVIFINDLIKIFINKTKLYADDTKLLSKVEDIINNENSLQKDLNEASEWSRKWLLGFNSSKCVIMHYGNNNPHVKYTLNGVELKESDCERDLGVYFSSNLKWKQHIISCTSKANSIMGMLKMTFFQFDVKLVKILYSAFIRPLIEFAVPVWSPHFKGDIKLLEKVQHRMTRLVPSLRKLDYEKRLEILNITTLQKRRERGDLIQVFKILNNFDQIELIREPTLRYESITRGHKQKYEREKVNYLPRHNFIMNRSANLWNALPEEIINSKTINEFKNRYDKHQDYKFQN